MNDFKDIDDESARIGMILCNNHLDEIREAVNEQLDEGGVGGTVTKRWLVAAYLELEE